MLEKLIAKLRSYAPVDEVECQAVASAFHAAVVFPRGQVFVRAGQEPHSSALLVSGFAHRVKELYDGRRQAIEIYVPGDFVDLDSFVLQRSEHDIRCLSTCRVAAVSHVRLREVTAEFPRIGQLLWLCTTADAALHRERITSLGARTAVERLAQFMCETALRLKVVGLGDEKGFDLPLTQCDLAEILGLSIVHINRTIRELRERGLAEISRRWVRIADWEGLSKLADFNDRYLGSMETNARAVRLVTQVGDARISNERRQDQAWPPGRNPDIAQRRLRGRLLDFDPPHHAR